MKILSVDVESNGLTGQPFAIGAVCTDDDDPEADVYAARCNLVGPTDPWVLANVFPAVRGIPKVPSGGYVELLTSFAAWYDAHKDGALVIAHVGVPVEARLFRDLIWFLGRDPLSGPFPLHDLATLLYAAGEDPLSEDAYLAKHGLTRPTIGCPDVWVPHNPLYDACGTEVAWRHLAGRLAADRGATQ